MRCPISLAFSFWTTTYAATVLQLNGTSYYSPDVVIGVIDLTGLPKSMSQPTPVTLISKPPTSASDLQNLIETFLLSDDVFSEAFLSTIVFVDDSPLPKDVEAYLTSSEVTIIQGCSTSPPSGPYFLQPNGGLTKAFRLYVDYNMAFTQGVVQGDNDSFIASAASSFEEVNGAVSIPVPSRLYYDAPSLKRPLSGLRFGVKDVMDLKGVKTGAGSRAYFRLTEPASESAPLVQKLVDLGAVAIGKTKSSQFAFGEFVTADFVDQIGPWNPRGDEYQNPQTSSCGSGSAVATYDWIDFATAADTGGSVRLPARANGIFGMRTTTGSVSLERVLPITPQMDSPGLLFRDAKLLRTAYAAWFSPHSKYTSYPKRIILPDEFWPTVNDTSMPLYESFIEGLATFLNADVIHMNTNDSFKSFANYPDGLTSFTNLVNVNMTNYDHWHLLGSKFLEEYQSQYGRMPYVNPSPRVRWEAARDMPKESYDKAVSRMHTYRDWFRSQLTPTCEDALVLYPFGPGLEDYRDFYKTAPSASAYPPYWDIIQASLSALPDYTIPIGFREYWSRVTERMEELPVSIGIIGAAGCDGMLADLVVEMEDSINGFSTLVSPGRTLYKQSSTYL